MFATPIIPSTHCMPVPSHGHLCPARRASAWPGVSLSGTECPFLARGISVRCRVPLPGQGQHKCGQR